MSSHGVPPSQEDFFYPRSDQLGSDNFDQITDHHYSSYYEYQMSHDNNSGLSGRSSFDNDSGDSIFSPVSSTSPSAAPARPPSLRPSFPPIVPSLSPAPIPTTTAPDSSTDPATAGVGPLTGQYAIPPRPKPGRKPATDEPANKRKAQNRQSQRNFRLRKQQKTEELEARIAADEKRHCEQLREKEIEIQKLNESNARLQEILKGAQAQSASLQAQVSSVSQERDYFSRERDYWKNKFEQLESQSQLSAFDQHRQYEQDFTTRHTSFSLDGISGSHRESPTRETVAHILQTLHGGQTMSGLPMSGQMMNGRTVTGQAVDGGCGNCEAGGKCACVDELTQIPGP